VPAPYEVLGIARDADEDEIVSAYRDRVKEAHPDQGGSPREFRRVRSAYLALRNGEVDADIDAGEETPPGSEEGPAEDDAPAAEEEEETETISVEYLNYDALADHGWTLDDDRLFERAAAADLDAADYGVFAVEQNQSLLEAAEANGFAWPFACRGGACSNCAVAVIEGEMPPPVNHVLTPELLERGIRLSCVSAPVTTDTKVVFNVKHLPGVEELLLPASRFEQAHSGD
jgi:ferredoxin